MSCESPPEQRGSSKSAAKMPFPGFIEPMLATLTGEAFSGEQWIFENKFDGYRVIAAKQDGIKLYSRNGNDFTERYHVIAGELSPINARFVIDGEVCYRQRNGKFNFQKLQHGSHNQDNLHYFVFDLLWLNGHDLKELPLEERKKLLEILLKNVSGHIHLAEYVQQEGERFFREIEKEKREGMIAKRFSGRYYPGERTREWLKVKTSHRQEMIICGYLPSEKENRIFSSLLCAVNRKGKLVYTGRVGTGFSGKLQKEIMGKMKKLERKKVPVDNPPSLKHVHWLKPELICEVQFSSWTGDRIMRHPSFIALREDKQPGQIRIERPQPSGKAGKRSKAKLTNLNKAFWPEEGFTKDDVVAYYRDISSFILPYLRDRPQNLYRTPEGIKEEGFFQKNVEEIAPEWAETVSVKSKSKGSIEYLLCQNRDTLLYMANLGCVEINPWSSTLPDLEMPDIMVFDLDPVDVEFSRVVEIALRFKNLFDQLGMPAFCKTSGSRGIHIYVPLQQKYSYGQVQKFVKTIESHVHKETREITSLERSPSKRKGKIYLDYLQNAKGKTMSSAYSLRPRPGAPVSAPLRWEELTPELDPLQFNLGNMADRLEREGDVWDGFFDQRVDIGEVLEF